MTDTPAHVQALHTALLMGRSNNERLRMCVSMNQTARRLVWASIPESWSEDARREAFLRRYYGRELDSATAHRISLRRPRPEEDHAE